MGIASKSDTLSLAIFYQYDFRNDLSRFKDLLAEFKNISLSQPLNKIELMFTATASYTKKKGFSLDIIDELKDEIKNGKYSDFILTRNRTGFEGGASLFSSGGINSLQHMDITIKNEIIITESDSIDRIINFVKSAWELIRGAYGLIVAGPTWNFASTECSATVISTFGVEPTQEEKRRNEELHFYQRERDQLRDYIRKAYWGNFLNAKHVAKLGGFSNIQSKAPCYKVEPLPEGGAYIQLTESPFDFGKSDFPKKLKALDDFLQPAILPGRPAVNFEYNSLSK